MIKTKIVAYSIGLTLLAACGMQATEVKPVKPVEIKETVLEAPKNIDVCIKDSSGLPIQTASGLCWQPGEVVVLSKPVEQPKIVEQAKPIEQSKEKPKTVEQQKTAVIEKLIADIEKKPVPINEVPKSSIISKTKKAISSIPTYIKKKKEQFVAKIEETKVFTPVEPTPEVITFMDKLSYITVEVNTPAKLRSNEQSTIVVVADLSKIPKRDKITDDANITAKLFAPGFRASTITRSSQSILQGSYLKWEWEIEPTSKGKQEIVVSLSASVPNQKGSEKYVGTYNKTINVYTTILTHLWNFLTNGWVQIFTILVVGGVTYLTQRKAKKP